MGVLAGKEQYARVQPTSTGSALGTIVHIFIFTRFSRQGAYITGTRRTRSGVNLTSGSSGLQRSLHDEPIGISATTPKRTRQRVYKLQLHFHPTAV